MVYQKILQFYKLALEILSKKRAKFAITMVLETDRLPNIVQDFLKHSNDLQKILEKATLEIVEDIEVMLYDHESKFSYA